MHFNGRTDDGMGQRISLAHPLFLLLIDFSVWSSLCLCVSVVNPLHTIPQYRRRPHSAASTATNAISSPGRKPPVRLCFQSGQSCTFSLPSACGFDFNSRMHLV